MLNLRGKDIGTDEALLTFRSREGAKGRGKDRYVPISEELANYLRTLAVVVGGKRLFLHGRSTVRDWWNEICESAMIKGVTLHGIRATVITRSLDKGVPVVDVQKMVGHSDIAMTMRYYRNSEQNQTAARRMREAIGFQSPSCTEESKEEITEPS